jgi:putative acetyltransferase
MGHCAVTLRRYRISDEAVAIELWRRTWQEAYPTIDFSARVEWWRKRWSNELTAASTVMVAEFEGAMVGFVTVDQLTGYLDQVVVAPEAWGRGIAAALIAAAKSLSPRGLDLHVNKDNSRAIHFYRKHGFATVGEDVNPRSGAPVYKMSWQPDPR